MAGCGWGRCRWDRRRVCRPDGQGPGAALSFRQAPLARIAEDDRSTIGRLTKHHAGGACRPSVIAAVWRRRYRANMRGTGARRARGPPRSGQHAHRHRGHDPLPAVPTVELRQIVRPHQPDEPHAGIECPQPRQRLRGVAGAEPRLDVGDGDAGVDHHGLCLRQTQRQRCRALPLQRVARADQPPDAVQPEPLQRLARDVDMARMGRVERPTQQPHHHAARGCREPVPHQSPATIAARDVRTRVNPSSRVMGGRCNRAAPLPAPKTGCYRMKRGVTARQHPVAHQSGVQSGGTVTDGGVSANL